MRLPIICPSPGATVSSIFWFCHACMLVQQLTRMRTLLLFVWSVRCSLPTRFNIQLNRAFFLRRGRDVLLNCWTSGRRGCLSRVRRRWRRCRLLRRDFNQLLHGAPRSFLELSSENSAFTCSVCLAHRHKSHNNVTKILCGRRTIFWGLNLGLQWPQGSVCYNGRSNYTGTRV